MNDTVEQPAEDGGQHAHSAGEATSGSAPADDAPPAAPKVPAPEPTGLPNVDAALGQLSEIDALDVNDHVEVYDDVQRRLHDALAELDDEQ
jgi:hypothetical protein